MSQLKTTMKFDNDYVTNERNTEDSPIYFPYKTGNASNVLKWSQKHSEEKIMNKLKLVISKRRLFTTQANLSVFEDADLTKCYLSYAREKIKGLQYIGFDVDTFVLDTFGEFNESYQQQLQEKQKLLKERQEAFELKMEKQLIGYK